MKDERSMDADRAERLRTYLQEKDHEADVTPPSDVPSTEAISSLSAALRRATVSDSEPSAAAASKSDAASNQAKLHADVDQLLKVDDQDAFFRAVNADEGDPSDVSFEELFSKFAEMKETAASLPPDQRKAYAEKVTIAFWRAIGGDEGEIAGIGDSSDDDEGREVSDKH